MSATERRGLFVGLAALAAAAVVLELSLTRVGAVVLGTEAASAVAPLALVAAALGALAAAASSSDRARPTLAVLAELAAAGSVAAIMVVLHVSDSKVGTPGAEVAALAGRSRGEALVIAAAAALPFAFGGAATGAALRALGDALGLAAFALGAGAAAGTVGGVVALRFGGPRTALCAAVLFGVASAALTAASRARAASEPAAPPADPDHLPSATDLSLAATAVVGTLVLLAGDVGAPWLKLKVARLGLPEKVELHRWSELGLLTADRAANGVAAVRVDGVKRGTLVDGRGNPPPEPEDLAFAFAPDRGPTLVVDPGGAGRTARAALKAGQKELACVVGGVALSHELTAGELHAFGATLHGDPRVHSRMGDGRAEVRAADGGLRLVVVSAAASSDVPPVAWPRAGAGAALADAALVTREALVDDLARLAPEGAVVVRAGADPERLVVTMVAALRASGATEPMAHLFACGTKDASAVLARKTPLPQADVRTLRGHCQRAKLTELFAPDAPKSDLARRLVGDRAAPPAPSATPSAASSALAPSASAAPPAPAPVGPSGIPTDDRPFVAAAAPSAGALAAQPGERLPLVAGGAGLAIFFAAGLFARARGAAGSSGGSGAALAAGFLGVGVAAMEMLLGRWLTSALGHPVFALLVIAPALAAGLAIGALFVDETDLAVAAPRAARLAVAGALLILLCGLALGPLARAVSAAPTAARLAAALLVVACVAVPVGGALPLVLRLSARARAGGAATALALHLLGQVVALGLGTIVVVHVGFLALAACAAGAFGLVASLARAAAPADAR